MKAVIQRVLNARVTVNEELISSIGRGICVLIGLGREDNDADVDFIVRKLVNLRVFDGEDGKRWCKSVSDCQYEILCISQFTLHATLKGNKPDFHLSMAPDRAPEFYGKFMEKLRKSYIPELVKDGQFGAYMQVHIQNDGPVTISIDSRKNSDQDKTAEEKS